MNTRDVPVRFQGSQVQADMNRETHRFTNDDGDVRCAYCDSRPSYEAANYPCGAVVPRKQVGKPQ
jgi:hypothetical protein